MYLCYKGLTGLYNLRGGSRISGKGVLHMYKGVGGSFCWFDSFFLNIPWKWNNLVSLRPNYFIFMGYLKTGAGRGVQAKPSLDPPLNLSPKVHMKKKWKLEWRKIKIVKTNSVDDDGIDQWLRPNHQNLLRVLVYQVRLYSTICIEKPMNE